MRKNRKAVAYIRVSTRSQEDNTSLKEQRDCIEAYAKSQHIEIVAIFQEVKGGTNLNRKQYKDMMNYIKENDIDLVISYKIDRIHRKQINFLHMIEQLNESDCHFASVCELIDTSSQLGKMIMSLLSMFAEYEADAIKERMRAGKQAKQSNLKDKEIVAGSIPFGYDSNFEIIADEAHIVQSIFSNYIKLGSLGKVQRVLNDLGYITRLGKVFSRDAIYKILMNRAYIGIYKFGGKKYVDHHEAIVTNYKSGRANKLLKGSF